MLSISVATSVIILVLWSPLTKPTQWGTTTGVSVLCKCIGCPSYILAVSNAQFSRRTGINTILFPPSIRPRTLSHPRTQINGFLRGMTLMDLENEYDGPERRPSIHSEPLVPPHLFDSLTLPALPQPSQTILHTPPIHCPLSPRQLLSLLRALCPFSYIARHCRRRGDVP